MDPFARKSRIKQVSVSSCSGLGLRNLGVLSNDYHLIALINILWKQVQIQESGYWYLIGITPPSPLTVASYQSLHSYMRSENITGSLIPTTKCTPSRSHSFIFFRWQSRFTHLYPVHTRVFWDIIPPLRLCNGIRRFILVGCHSKRSTWRLHCRW